MPSRPYTIQYKAPSAQAIASTKALEAALARLDKQVTKVRANLAGLGATAAGITAAAAAMNGLAGASGNAAKASANVGKGNRSVAALTDDSRRRIRASIMAMMPGLDDGG